MMTKGQIEVAYKFAPHRGAAVVTGSGAGIGKEIARALASKGTAVAVCDIDLDTARQTAAEIGSSSKAYQVDLGQIASIDKAMDSILTDFDQIGILVNCAGIVLEGNLGSTAIADWHRTLAVNLAACFRICQTLSAHMVKQGGGRIINIASETAYTVFPDRLAYATSKSALISFTRSIAVELARSGVTANSISPTVVMTEMGRRLWTGEKAKTFLKGIPVGRFATCEDVAAAALFLGSQDAGMITGVDLLIDGGNTAVA